MGKLVAVDGVLEEIDTTRNTIAIVEREGRVSGVIKEEQEIDFPDTISVSKFEQYIGKKVRVFLNGDFGTNLYPLKNAPEA